MALPTNQSSDAGAIPSRIVSQNSYSNITTSASTLVKTGAGGLHSITINTKGATATATIYDGLTAAGTKIGTLDVSNPGTYTFDVAFALGLFIVTAGTTPADMTVSYR
jgi:hypothetical protein